MTAAITWSFIARATQQADRERRKDEVSDRELIEKRFDELEQKLDDLAAWESGA